jgi:hypothetical protein
MKPGAAEAVGNPPLSLYPGMRFDAGWDGRDGIPVNRDIPLSTRWANGIRPLVRGWLVLSGCMVPGPAEDLPGWMLPWPCRLADLGARLSEVQICEEAARQEWLDQGVDAGGVPRGLALEQQARVVVWLLDRDSAQELGWPGGPGRTAGEADEVAHDDDLQRLALAMVHLVPGAVFRLDAGPGHRAQAARYIVADLLALEQTGRTHGRCLARMRKNVLSKVGLPLNSAPLRSMGEAL